MREVPSLVDRLVGGCFAVLLGCLALYGAVQIIRCIWPWLAVGAVLASIVGGGAWAVRRWWQFWIASFCRHMPSAENAFRSVLSNTQTYLTVHNIERILEIRPRSID